MHPGERHQWGDDDGCGGTRHLRAAAPGQRPAALCGRTLALAALSGARWAGDLPTVVCHLCRRFLWQLHSSGKIGDTPARISAEARSAPQSRRVDRAPFAGRRHLLRRMDCGGVGGSAPFSSVRRSQCGVIGLGRRWGTLGRRARHMVLPGTRLWAHAFRVDPAEDSASCRGGSGGIETGRRESRSAFGGSYRRGRLGTVDTALDALLPGGAPTFVRTSVCNYLGEHILGVGVLATNGARRIRRRVGPSPWCIRRSGGACSPRARHEPHDYRRHQRSSGRMGWSGAGCKPLGFRKGDEIRVTDWRRGVSGLPKRPQAAAGLTS